MQGPLTTAVVAEMALISHFSITSGDLHKLRHLGIFRLTWAAGVLDGMTDSMILNK